MPDPVMEQTDDFGGGGGIGRLQQTRLVVSNIRIRIGIGASAFGKRTAFELDDDLAAGLLLIMGEV